MSNAREAGYTLTELLVVLAIMGMLAAAAMPMLSAASPGFEAKAAARALAQDLRATRQQAIDRGAVERVTFAAHRYGVPGATRALPGGVALAAHGEIVFYPDGSSSGGTVVVASAHARHRVQVRWPSGRISVDE